MDIAGRLEQFLGSDLPETAAAASGEFDAAAGATGEIVIYGCGKLGRAIAAGLERAGRSPAGFADANSGLSGALRDGLPVFSPEEAIAKFGRSHVFVVTVWRNHEGVKKDLVDAGALNVVHFLPLLWKYPEALLPYYSLDLPAKMLRQSGRIRQAFGLLGDRESQEIFVSQLQWMISLRSDIGVANSPAESQYFPDDLFTIGDSEVFVDCGAYDGDTIKIFIDRMAARFAHIVAVEPDPVNLGALADFLKTLSAETQRKIQIEPCGLGAGEGTVTFDAAGSEASAINPHGTVSIQIKTLDGILGALEPTYIKMDIEGAELDALRGAAKSIAQSTPKLAICVYHLQDHLWEIPLEIHGRHAGYRIFLRRYRDEFGDVVCYALPPR